MRLLALLLVSCSLPLQVPGARPECGAVPVSADLLATAAHCPAYGDVAHRDELADLMFVRRESKRWAKLADAHAGEATLRDLTFDIVDATIESDGRKFVRVHPEFEPGHSGSGLWQSGKLIGIAIGNDGTFGAAVHSSEVSRVLELTR